MDLAFMLLISVEIPQKFMFRHISIISINSDSFMLLMTLMAIILQACFMKDQLEKNILEHFNFIHMDQIIYMGAVLEPEFLRI